MCTNCGLIGQNEDSKLPICRVSPRELTATRLQLIKLHNNNQIKCNKRMNSTMSNQLVLGSFRGQVLPDLSDKLVTKVEATRANRSRTIQQQHQQQQQQQTLITILNEGRNIRVDRQQQQQQRQQQVAAVFARDELISFNWEEKYGYVNALNSRSRSSRKNNNNNNNTFDISNNKTVCRFINKQTNLAISRVMLMFSMILLSTLLLLSPFKPINCLSLLEEFQRSLIEGQAQFETRTSGLPLLSAMNLGAKQVEPSVDEEAQKFNNISMVLRSSSVKPPTSLDSSSLAIDESLNNTNFSMAQQLNTTLAADDDQYVNLLMKELTYRTDLDNNNSNNDNNRSSSLTSNSSGDSIVSNSGIGQNHDFGQRIGVNLEATNKGFAISREFLSNSNEKNASLAEFGERAALSRLAELFPVSKRELIITKLLRQYRKPRSQPTSEPQATGVKSDSAAPRARAPTSSVETTGGDGFIAGFSSNWQPHFESGSETATTMTPTTMTTDSTTVSALPTTGSPLGPLLEEASTLGPLAAINSLMSREDQDYHLVKLREANNNNNNNNKSRLHNNHRMDQVEESSSEQPLAAMYVMSGHQVPTYNSAYIIERPDSMSSTSNNSNSNHNNNRQQLTLAPAHWQASNIEQVIHTAGNSNKQATEKSELFKSQGNHEQLHEGEKEKAREGERIRDREMRGHWERNKHGEQRQVAGGGKQAKEGDKWVKDVGHKRHGWKNVYHKEEYANHQKYHDVMLDKDWDNKRAKQHASYHLDNGEKFNDSRSNNLYDKNRHGTKYDYVRGSNWKKQEEEDHHNNNNNNLFDASANADEIADEVHSHNNRLYNGKQQQVNRHYNEPAPSHMDQEQVHPDPGADMDDATIDEMRDRLNRMSDSTRYSLGEPTATTTTTGPDDNNSRPESVSSQWVSSQTAANSATTLPEPPDYETAATDEEGEQPHNGGGRFSHQSINDILKTAKQRKPHLNRNNTRTNESQQSSNDGDWSRNVSQDLANVMPAPTTTESTPGGGGGDDDDEDGSSGGELEPTERPKETPLSSSRKNGLRLKLELDLSKAIPARAAGVGSGLGGKASTKVRRNYTTTNSGGPQQVGGPTGQLNPAADPRNYQRGNMLTANGYRNQTARWQQAKPTLATLHYPPTSQAGSRPNNNNNNNHRVQGPHKKEAVDSHSHLHSHSGGSGSSSHLRSGQNANRSRASQNSAQNQQTFNWPSLNRQQYPLPVQAPNSQVAGTLQVTPSISYQQQQQQQQQQRFNMSPSQVTSRNFTNQALSALSHVLPNRPIFVKHLQMNGGIMLGSKMPPPSIANRSGIRVATGGGSNQHSMNSPPLILPDSSSNGGGNSEDLTIETSLSNAFGDIVTLPGGQQVIQVPQQQQQQQQQQQLQQYEQEAEGNMVEAEHASRDHQYNMLSPTSSSFGGSSALFGSGESANSLQLPRAEPSHHHHHHHHQSTSGLTGSQSPVAEPNVIFEPEAGFLDDDDPLDQDAGTFLGQAQASNDMESLLAGDADQTQLMGLNGEGQSFNSGGLMSQSAPSFILDQSNPSTSFESTRDKTSPLSSQLLPDHFKPMPSALDYASVLLNHAAPSFVIPAVQQTFARFLRIPRVFSQAYRHHLPVATSALQSSNQLQQMHHQQQMASQHQFTLAAPQEAQFSYHLQAPLALDSMANHQQQQQLQARQSHRHHQQHQFHNHNPMQLDHRNHQHQQQTQVREAQLRHRPPPPPTIVHLQIEESRAAPAISVASASAEEVSRWRSAPSTRANKAGQLHTTGELKGRKQQPHGFTSIDKNSSDIRLYSRRRPSPLPARPQAVVERPPKQQQQQSLLKHNRYPTTAASGHHHLKMETGMRDGDLMGAASSKFVATSVVKPPPSGLMLAASATPPAVRIKAPPSLMVKPSVSNSSSQTAAHEVEANEVAALNITTTNNNNTTSSALGREALTSGGLMDKKEENKGEIQIESLERKELSGKEHRSRRRSSSSSSSKRKRPLIVQGQRSLEFVSMFAKPEVVNENLKLPSAAAATSNNIKQLLIEPYDTTNWTSTTKSVKLLDSSFVAPKNIQQTNDWIPSKGFIGSRLSVRPTNVTWTRSQSFNGIGTAEETKTVAGAAKKRQSSSGFPLETAAATSGDSTKPQQHSTQGAHQRLQGQEKLKQISWFNVPYASNGLGLPKQQQLSPSMGSMSNQSLLASTLRVEPLKPDLSASVLALGLSGGVGDSGGSRSTRGLPLPTLSPKLAASPLQINQLVKVLPISSSSSSSSTKAPFHFGQRILASFKSKLNNVSG